MSPRDGSIGGASVGAASLGARRDAPAPKQAPSVRSDERPIATQGDMLNSIKFQRRLRETLHSDKMYKMYNDKNSLTLEKSGVKKVEICPRMNAGSRFVKRDYATCTKSAHTEFLLINHSLYTCLLPYSDLSVKNVKFPKCQVPEVSSGNWETRNALSHFVSDIQRKWECDKAFLNVSLP